jgi:hypothetical protein
MSEAATKANELIVKLNEVIEIVMPNATAEKKIMTQATIIKLLRMLSGNPNRQERKRIAKILR